jgi:hypothetical protein
MMMREAQLEWQREELCRREMREEEEHEWQRMELMRREEQREEQRVAAYQRATCMGCEGCAVFLLLTVLKFC